MSKLPHSGGHSASASGNASIGTSGHFTASTESGRASKNFARVSQIFLDAWQSGDIELGSESIHYIEKLAQELYHAGPPLSDVVNYEDLTQTDNWRGPQPLLSLIYLAAWSSEQVYSLSTRAQIATPPNGPAKLLEAQPSGAAKNWALFSADPNTDLTASNPAKTFVFAVRGTSTSAMLEMFRDNTTNLDAKAVRLGDKLEMMAHRGFKAAGQAIFKEFVTVSERVWTEPQAKSKKSDLVLTGHSAGGGTAYFLYYYLLTERPDLLDRFEHVYVLTFGSAAITSHGEGVKPRTMDRIISFILCEDPVPRADLAYAGWIANNIGKLLVNMDKNRPGPALTYDPLPRQELFPGGELVLLQEDGLANKLLPDRLGSKAFLGLPKHKAKKYLMAVEGLLED